MLSKPMAFCRVGLSENIYLIRFNGVMHHEASNGGMRARYSKRLSGYKHLTVCWGKGAIIGLIETISFTPKVEALLPDNKQLFIYFNKL